ncbi:MAG: hypothetical protein ACQESN_02775 [Thermotogota bacterium]
MKKTILITVAVLLISLLSFSTFLNDENNVYNLNLEYENGWVSVLSHTLQFGENGTEFDFVEQGGQDILFPFERFTADLELFSKHHIVFLYQPLTVETKVQQREELIFNDTTFATATNEESVLNVKYGFPFWRVSYLYDFLEDENYYLSAGLSLQLRNASIIFENYDGSKVTVNQNLGPVPIIKLKAAYFFDNGIYIETDSDGFYASSKFFNGADFEFTGSIFDISGRIGFKLKESLNTFINIRYLGGTSEGVSQYENSYWSQSGEQGIYSNNFLNTATFTLGFEIK